MNFEEKVYSLLHLLNQFQYHYEHNDRLWHIIFLHKKANGTESLCNNIVTLFTLVKKCSAQLD
jgi:hypothetical protein